MVIQQNLTLTPISLGGKIKCPAYRGVRGLYTQQRLHTLYVPIIVILVCLYVHYIRVLVMH